MHFTSLLCNIGIFFAIQKFLGSIIHILFYILYLSFYIFVYDIYIQFYIIYDSVPKNALIDTRCWDDASICSSPDALNRVTVVLMESINSFLILIMCV